MTIDGLDGQDLSTQDAASFAVQLADLAVAFLDERDPDRLTLTEQIVAGAIAVIPGVVAAAVETMSKSGRLDAPIMEGDGVARHLMNVQNELGQGPCRDALRDNKQILITDLHGEPRGPAFAEQAVIAGVRSMVCTPMGSQRRANRNPVPVLR